jgi:hypothetical protein
VLVRLKAASALRCTPCTGFCRHLELAGAEQAGSAGRLCLFQVALEREVKEYLNENRTAPRVTYSSQVCALCWQSSQRTRVDTPVFRHPIGWLITSHVSAAACAWQARFPEPESLDPGAILPEVVQRLRADRPGNCRVFGTWNARRRASIFRSSQFRRSYLSIGT